MSGFNFGNPTSTGASAGSLFGTSAAGNSGGSTNIFGSTSNTGGGSAGFSFGQTAATTSAGEQKPLFGAVTSGQPSLFGAQSGGFSFAKPSETSKPAEQPKPAFAGFGTASQPTQASQPPATPGTSAPTTSLFGSTTPATTTKQAWSFGNPSTTPAGPPPSSTTFSASTGGGGLFGNTQSQQAQGTQPTSQPGLFSFAKPAATTAAPASATTQSASTPSLFGSGQPATSSNLFGAKPAEKPNETSKPAEIPKFSFGAPSSTTTSSSSPSLFGTAPVTSSATTSSQPTPSLFGGAPATTQSASNLFGANSATTSSSTTPFGGNMFSKQPTTTGDTTTKSFFFMPPLGQTTKASDAPAQPATTQTSQKFPFGGLGSSATTSSSSPSTTFNTAPALSAPPASSMATSAATTTAPSAPLGGFLSLGGATTSSSTQPTTSTSIAAPTNTIKPAPITGLGSSTLGASTSGPLPPAQSRLKNKTMDEILTRWATDLTRYTKDFKSQAETIAKWDQIIVDNSSKIDKLYIKTRTCEKQTMSVEMQLSVLENQQNELESWLSKYEGDVEEMLSKESNTQTNEIGGPDQERERTYKLAEKLGEQLEDMGKNLEGMVEEVNAANAGLNKHGKNDEPVRQALPTDMYQFLQDSTIHQDLYRLLHVLTRDREQITQIVRILNSHLTQLQTIDQGTAALQAKVSAAQNHASTMGYANGGANGKGRAAVDDFYRSYMGRR